ncbi:unnamed protein product [Meloidogyne enterolobii]|uniref:Uncharacterized protein n=1 Tax=Meloidogyne enterolobii TaxID=390850 RepID=A0ACB1A820_MELEN
MALGDFIRQLLSSDLSCEVDPLRLCNGNASSSGSSSSGSGSSISSQLEKSRQQLTRQVETAWRRILACQHLFPYPLRLLFSGLRHRLEQAGRAELTDNLLSSSIFLRFLCPAILSPSLFGLVNEYPTGQAARNLTLIAKSLQTLANFTRFGGKEGYMEFMNNFVEREWRNMQHFLRQISAPCARYCQACEAHDSMVDCTIDLGKELSLLASYMREHCDQLMEQRKENLNLNKNSNTTTTLIAIKQLWNALMTISNWGNNCCDKEGGEEDEEGNEEGKKFFKEDNEGGMTSTIEGHSPGNPPSDYENNNTVITTTTTKVPESLWRQPPPIPMARRTVMIPQPIEIPSENKYNRGNLYGGGGEGCQPISAPPVPNSPFSFLSYLNRLGTFHLPRNLSSYSISISLIIQVISTYPIYFPVIPPIKIFKRIETLWIEEKDEDILSQLFPNYPASKKVEKNYQFFSITNYQIFKNFLKFQNKFLNIYSLALIKFGYFFQEQKTRFSFSPNNNNSSSYVSTAAVHHLNTSDDYVLSSALSKLRTTTKPLNPPTKQQCWNSNNSSCIHLYDETSNRRGVVVDNLQQQQQQHLYDEVPTDSNLTILPPPSASRALNAGVVIAHRGVASHEATQRRGELCTPRVIQRNAFRAMDDEADDESESEEDGRVQEIVEENEEFNQRRPPPNRRRRPPSANGYTNSSIISHVRNCSSGEQQQQQHYGIFNESINNFDSSSASVGSNNRKKNIGGINQMIIPPSSGYQSQLNSSSYSNSSSPTNTTESSPPPPSQQQTTSIISNLIQSPKILLKNPPKISKNVFSSNIISSNNSCQSSSSSSASSAYSSLSPTNQQKQQQHLFNNKLRKSAENAAMHLLEELNAGKSEQQTRTELQQQQQQHLPKPRHFVLFVKTNPSCWSIPASSSGHLQQQQPPQPRSAFIGSNPTDPLTAFVRYPLHSSSSPQKISPKKLEEEKEDYQRKFPQKFPTCSEIYWSENNNKNKLISSTSEINSNIPWSKQQILLPSQQQVASQQQHVSQQQASQHQTTIPNLLAAELELIEAQRCQIAELTRQNAALRQELNSVRAISSQHIVAGREEKIIASAESM